ncbi:MAG TPA: RluA family pseudouridine synthase [Nitrospiraceae bacterium]|nr:RluA family pseudouridine synthase [Nitrospiraceae bacterium]
MSIIEPVELIVTAGESSKRLDLFLANRDATFSRTALQRLIDEGHIQVNGQPVRPSHKIRPGDRITLRVPRPQPLDLQPEAIAIEPLYEDGDVLVLNKPAGLVVHPAPGNWTGTLVNALLHHFAMSGVIPSNVGGKERPGLVHRLDKETSGVMVIAKTDQAHRSLAAQFKQHTIARVYEALVWAVPSKGRGIIELAIGRDSKERKKFSARTTKPKPSVTEYHVERRYARIASHLRLVPRTGRTHQLRVHMTSLGHPILGDRTYGGSKVMIIKNYPVPRVMLHARTLAFVHPTTGEEHRFDVPLPDDMRCLQQFLEEMREESPEQAKDRQNHRKDPSALAVGET